VAGAALAVLVAAAPAADLKPGSGARAPALALKDRDGRLHDLAAYRGKVVVVNFWAVWCEPCRDEMPSLNRLRERFARRPFEVVAVNLGDSDARIAEFVAKIPLDFPVLPDRTGRSKQDWQVKLLPASFVVGPDGRVRYRALGELDWNEPKVVAAIERLLPAR
jgi:thiol-disulfide isomerase/thioredoxin